MGQKKNAKTKFIIIIIIYFASVQHGFPFLKICIIHSITRLSVLSSLKNIKHPITRNKPMTLMKKSTSAPSTLKGILGYIYSISKREQHKPLNPDLRIFESSTCINVKNNTVGA